MITIEDIKSYSKPHRLEGGRVTKLFNDELSISIVGGVSGLYGDFEEDFEVAVIDRDTGNFLTKFFYPDLNDEVFAYMSKEELENFVNKLFHNGFQVD